MQWNYDILWGKIALDKNSMEHWFTMKKNNSAIQKTINVCYGQNYGIITKTMVLHQRLWIYDLLWKKNMKLLGTLKKIHGTTQKTMEPWFTIDIYGGNLWHSTENDGTLIYYGAMIKTMVLWKKNYDTIQKPMVPK